MESHPEHHRPAKKPEARSSSASGWQQSFREAGPYLHLGLQLGLSLIFFVGVGYLLDRLLGTMPWMIIAGALVGMVAAFIYLVRVSNEMNSRNDKGSKKPQNREGNS
jgi:F0F1-type ATP synthase assembly protein I